MKTLVIENVSHLDTFIISPDNIIIATMSW